MRTIQEMREKYWSGVKTLWPAKHGKVAVPFCWEGIRPDPEIMLHVHGAARAGEWQQANYYLTAAYQGGPENDEFWNQFI